MRYVIVNEKGEYFNGVTSDDGSLNLIPTFSSVHTYLLDENTYLRAEKAIRTSLPNEKFQVRTVEFNALHDFH